MLYFCNIAISYDYIGMLLEVLMMEGTLERLDKKLNEQKREFHQVLNSLENHRRKICTLQVAELKQGKMRQQAEENTRELEESFINLLKVHTI